MLVDVEGFYISNFFRKKKLENMMSNHWGKEIKEEGENQIMES